MGRLYDIESEDGNYRLIEGKYQFLDTNITGHFKLFEIAGDIPNDPIRADVGEFSEHIVPF